MSIEDLKDKIRGIIKPVIHDLGLELVDIELNRMRGKALLRVYIEKEDGITIDDCERVSREIEAILDVEDPIPYSYVLEVSSPGLDRPLKDPGDFERYKGKSIRVVTKEPIEKQTFFLGKLIRSGDDSIVLLLPKNKEVIISHNNISRARLEVEV